MARTILRYVPHRQIFPAICAIISSRLGVENVRSPSRVFTYEDTAIVEPNSDTPYSFAWLAAARQRNVTSMTAFCSRSSRAS